MSEFAASSTDQTDTAASAAATPRTRVAHAAVRNRLVGLVVFAATFGLLAVAAWLSPDARGFGTHESLGLPPCGFKSATTLPCITCGMTTSFSHAANGNLIGAFTVQPAGTVLALLTAMGAVTAGLAVVFGFSLAPIGRMLARPRSVMVLGAILIAGWTYTLLIAFGF